MIVAILIFIATLALLVGVAALTLAALLTGAGIASSLARRSS